MAKLPHPEQKLAKLEILSALVSNLGESAVLRVVEQIDTPQMTKQQKELADKIFATQKPYEEQIEDFIREFNVPFERQETIRRFLKDKKLNEKYVYPPRIEEQVAIIDKKLQSIINNDKIPVDKKQAYIQQLESQKQDLLAM